MDESFPERPTLFFDFVLPSRPKYLFLNLWITDPHMTTPKLSLALVQKRASVDGAAKTEADAIRRLHKLAPSVRLFCGMMSVMEILRQLRV
jgi:hypothetical protein